MDKDNILSVNNLSVSFYIEEGIVKACDNVSFEVERGKNLGLVGESGCGKTMCCLSILKLIPQEGRIVSGEVNFEDKNILLLSNEGLRKIRGNEISMIFQEPMTSLNPLLTAGEQITEGILVHRKITYLKAKDKALELLHRVGIDNPKARFDDYPYSLSGGIRQRVMIAMAISCEPKVLIADEPTTALDVSTQVKILELLDELQREFNMSVLIVSHDFGVIARMADRIAVMYAGQIVEYAEAEDIFKDPLHPYTKGLLDSIRQIEKRDNNLTAIKGSVAELYNLPKGCRFYHRCKLADSGCGEGVPRLEEIRSSHYARCFKAKSKKF